MRIRRERVLANAVSVAMCARLRACSINGSVTAAVAAVMTASPIMMTTPPPTGPSCDTGTTSPYPTAVTV